MLNEWCPLHTWMILDFGQFYCTIRHTVSRFLFWFHLKNTKFHIYRKCATPKVKQVTIKSDMFFKTCIKFLITHIRKLRKDTKLEEKLWGTFVKCFIINMCIHNSGIDTSGLNSVTLRCSCFLKLHQHTVTVFRMEKHHWFPMSTNSGLCWQSPDVFCFQVGYRSVYVVYLQQKEKCQVDTNFIMLSLNAQ